MKKAAVLFVLNLSIFFATAQTNTLQYYFSEAREAHKAGDHKKFYEMIQEAHKLHPYHQGILYQAGIAAALNNNTAESIGYLTKAILINADFDLNHQDLNALTGNKDFENLKLLQQELQKPIITSDTAFLIKDRTLHIECIATGESKNIFYLGSIHQRKIIRVDEKGKVTDFTSASQDGLCSVFGIKVDATNNVLWACSSPTEEMQNFDSSATSAVYKYDLRTGKLLTKYFQDKITTATFGDLTISPDRKVFVSDSKNNTILIVNESAKKLEPYYTSEEFWSIQGLTFSADGRYLFIADYIKGIFRMDTKDKTLKLISHNLSVAVKSVDGLTFYNNSLVAVQNLVSPMRTTQYFLNNNSDEFTRYKIIDRGHPAFNEPTIGCVEGDTFYYVANSQWAGYDKQRKIKPADQLQDIVILKALIR